MEATDKGRDTYRTEYLLAPKSFFRKKIWNAGIPVDLVVNCCVLELEYRELVWVELHVLHR